MNEGREAGSALPLRWRLVRAVVLSPAFLLVLDAIAFVLFYFVVGPAIPTWMIPL